MLQVLKRATESICSPFCYSLVVREGLFALFFFRVFFVLDDQIKDLIIN